MYGFVSNSKSHSRPDILPGKIIRPFAEFATATIKSAVAGTLAVDEQTITNPYFRLFLTTRNGFFQGLPYIMIGISIANDGIIRSKKVLVGILLSGFVLQMIGYQFTTFITSYALFSLIIQIDFPERKDNLYHNFRMASTIMYLTHMLFVASITILLPIKFTNYLLFMIVVALSIVTAKIIILHKENRIVKMLFR